MIRTFQAIDWSVVPPEPVALHRRVSVFSGQNGSGKSSAMDALKAVLGVSRMGQGRTPASYIHSGRDLGAPAGEAFVLACCSLPDPPPFADPSGDFTLVLNVTRSRRLFLALPGHVLLGLTGDLAAELEDFKEQYPRKAWMSPDDYARRVLSVIGVSRATQRILEIPQGEAQRLLDARPDRLLRDLLGLMGALEPLEVLEERRGLYQEAVLERDRAKRALLEEELASARAEQQLGDGGLMVAAEKDLEEARARARGALASRRQALTGELEGLSRMLPELVKERDRLKGDLDQAEKSFSPASGAAHALIDELAASGIDARLAESGDAPESKRAAASEIRFAVIVGADDFERARLIAAAHPRAFLARFDDPESFWASRPDLSSEEAGAHLLLDGELLAPRPAPYSSPDQAASLRSSLVEAEMAVKEAERRSREVTELLLGLDGVDLGEGEEIESPADQLPGLLGEVERVEAKLSKLVKAESQRSQKLEALERQRERLQEARLYLDGQEGALEQARDALSDAREVYQSRVQRLVAELSRNFTELCAGAGMRGELELTEDPLAEAGGRLQVHVAETPDGPLRAYAEADLSGGWRAKTSLLVLLAALAASADGTMRLVLSDEPFAALDEDRIAEVGWTFQRLARSEGLQFVITLPTRRASEAVEWADLSVAFLKAAPDEQYAPLPHLLEAADDATLPPA